MRDFVPSVSSAGLHLSVQLAIQVYPIPSTRDLLYTKYVRIIEG